MSHPYFQIILNFSVAKDERTVTFLIFILITRTNFLLSALTTVPACQWFLTDEGDSDLYKGGRFVHCFHVTPPGPVWIWGGPPAGRACVSAPAARATSCRTPVLTTARLAQEEPSRVSLRKHRISPSLKTPGKSGLSRNTRSSCRRPSPYPNRSRRLIFECRNGLR